MKERIFDFETKYQTQNDLLDAGYLEYLDERTIHETLKAMLVNTTKDCIKYECRLDPEMSKISQIMFKEKRTKEELEQMKHSQERLKVALHLSQVAEKSLETLLYTMLMTDEFKHTFRQDIPELYESIYCYLDIEEDIAQSLVEEISESYQELSYKQICEIINNCIIRWVENAEEYIDDIKDIKLYGMFTEARDKWKKENANE